MRQDAPEKLDQYIKTKEDKKKLEHYYKHRSLISIVIRIAETSCRNCKSMVTRLISQGKTISPEHFCKYCAKKHEASFDKINKTMEDKE